MYSACIWFQSFFALNCLFLGLPFTPLYTPANVRYLYYVLWQLWWLAENWTLCYVHIRIMVKYGVCVLARYNAQLLYLPPEMLQSMSQVVSMKPAICQKPTMFSQSSVAWHILEIVLKKALPLLLDECQSLDYRFAFSIHLRMIFFVVFDLLCTLERFVCTYGWGCVLYYVPYLWRVRCRWKKPRYPFIYYWQNAIQI